MKSLSSHRRALVLIVLVLLTLGLCPGLQVEAQFIRGDANADAASNPSNPVNIADAIHVLGYLFTAGPAPTCLQTADANDDEGVDLGDAVYILGGLFSGGPPPTAPFPTCGPDPTPGALSCIAYPHCGVLPPFPQFTGLTHAGTNVQGYEEYTLDLDPTVVLILIPGGTFDMGQVGVAEPVHPVTLSPYLIAKSEITNAQYQAYCTATGTPGPTGPYCCGGVPSDHFTNPLYADHPVVKVSWFDVAGYCAWAGLALPTEAQWEYAARGPDGRTYPWGNEAPDEIGVYRANYCQWNGTTCSSLDGFIITNPVDSSAYSGFEGPFGTVGQAGNVMEWVADWYGSYPAGPVTNPTGPPTGSARVVRGGGWIYVASFLRSALRGDPSGQLVFVGFRPARVIP